MDNEIGMGTIVVISQSRHNDRLGIINGETKTCWRVGASLFYKKDLQERGRSIWHQSDIRIATSDDIKRIKERQHREAIIGEIGDFNLKRLATSELLQILHVINKYKQEQANADLY